MYLRVDALSAIGRTTFEPHDEEELQFDNTIKEETIVAETIFW